MPRLRFLPALIASSLITCSALIGVVAATERTDSGTDDTVKDAPPPKQTRDSRAAEAALKRHQQILAQVGRYDDERLQQYVNEVGQRIAAKSDRPDIKYTFTVLDSDEINAFAVPDGYVYMYRGMLAHLSSEAELAAILGHEIGHVTARHIAERKAGAAASAIGSTLVGVLTGNSGLMSAANMAGSAMVMGYSREQESEADELGTKFIERAGYDPVATIDGLRMAWAQEQYQIQKAREDGRGVSQVAGDGLFSSHPDPDKRLLEAEKQIGRSTARDEAEQAASRAKYLSMIDGMTVGSSAAQGVVRGSRFYHGGMGVTLAFPSGWRIERAPAKLVAAPPLGDRLIELSAQPVPPNTTPKAFLGRLLQGQPSTTIEPLDINGMEGYRANIRHATMPWGNKGPVAVAVVYNNGLAYVFVGATRIASQFNTFEPVFVSSLNTFRRLRDNEYAKAEPERIRLIKAAPGTSIEQIARNAPNPKAEAERLRLLNGLYPDKQPTPGQILKIVE